MSKATLLIPALVLAALLVFALGWFTGRWFLERQWGNPLVTLTADDVKLASVEGADPTPAAGTHIVRPLPLRRMREVMKSFTEKDPVVMKVGAVGRSDDKYELHLWLENRGDCKAMRVAGVAYGYHARGRAAAINKGGEAYVAFDVKDVKLDPKASGQVAMPLKDATVASLALAQVDLVECEGGKSWRR